MIKISQADIQEFLEKNKGKWFLVKEMATKMDITPRSCLNNTLRLIKHGVIKRRKSETVNNAFEYSHKEHQESMIRKKPLLVKELKEEFENESKRL